MINIRMERILFVVLSAYLASSRFTFSFTMNSLEKIYRRRSSKYAKSRNNRITPIINRTLTINFRAIDEAKYNNQTWREFYVHETLMNVALQQAKKAGEMGEVPIGAIIVIENFEICADVIEENENTLDGRDDKRIFTILSYGQNQIETIQDASAHAELQAMRSASENIQNWRLLNTTLYSTLEPCPMCLSAAQAFRVSKIVYGAPDLRLGAIKTHIKLLDIATHPFHDTMEVVGGVNSHECGQLLVDFFRKRRKQKKKGKKPIEMKISRCSLQTCVSFPSITRQFSDHLESCLATVLSTR